MQFLNARGRSFTKSVSGGRGEDKTAGDAKVSKGKYSAELGGLGVS
jgi:hypothetical protein